MLDCVPQPPARSSERPSGPPPRLAIAGASGFVGSALCRVLGLDYEIIALTRSRTRSAQADADLQVTWRHCDLYSQRQLETVLADCDYAIYLVHSMAPSARLTQAKMSDMDLILADNFARAAAAAGLKQIIYISSLLPQGYELSRLLWSRRELEMILAAQATPVTVLRSGLILGPGGSAPQIMLNLLRRLPVLVLPQAAHSQTQPIAITDLVRAVQFCLGREAVYGGIYDVGGPAPVSYADILRALAAHLGYRRLIVTSALMPLWLAAVVTRFASRAPTALVAPIMASLPHDIAVRDNPVQAAIAPNALSLRAALQATLDPNSCPPTRSLQPRQRDLDAASRREAKLVRSIQRLFLPPGLDARWVAGNYFHWIGHCCWPIIGCRVSDDGTAEMRLGLLPITLLRLRPAPERSHAHRQVYIISGGLLAKKQPNYEGRLEFRELLDGRYAVAAIHDYAPALPWPVYIVTQAVVHLGIMRHYQRHLARLLR